jgi:hypothetical protein
LAITELDRVIVEAIESADVQRLSDLLSYVHNDDVISQEERLLFKFKIYFALGEADKGFACLRELAVSDSEYGGVARIVLRQFRDNGYDTDS